MTHVDLERAIVRKAHLLALVLATTGSAFAINWNNSAGGVLTDDGNWKGGVAPTATQDAAFENSVNAPVTMSDDIPAKTNAVITINGNNLPLEFAFGKGHEYYASTRVSFAFGRRLTLSSGRLGGKTLYAPNQTGATLTPLRITVDGEDAELFGSFQFGAKGPSGNSLVLRNGGRYSGGLSVGVQSAACSGNRIVVTDPGSVLAATTLNLGQTAGDNVLMVTNGALLTASGDFNIGTVNSGTATSSNNVLIVADKARAVLPVTFRVGHKAGSLSNRVEVVKEGVMDLSRGSLSIGDAGASWDNSFFVDASTVVSTNADGAVKGWSIGTNGRGSRLEVANGSKIVLTNVNFVSGVTAEAHETLVRIADGSSIRLFSDTVTYHYVGQSGRGARLELDNGQWVSSRGHLRTGLNVSASNVTISVKNDSLIDVGSSHVIVGDHTEGNVLEVENGTVKASRITMAQSHTAGTDPDLRHDKLLIGGTNSLLRATDAVVLKRDTETVFLIPETGYVNVPVQAPNIELGDRGKVKVVVADKYLGPRRVVLMKSTAKFAKTGVVFETNRGRFDNTDDEIAVVLPRDRGLMLIFR